MEGVLLIDKPTGISSAKVVSKIKRHFGGIKAGHAGTLDPLATGLLAVLLGKATKLNDKLLAGDKTYSGTFKTGTATDTDDITGNVVFSSEQIPSLDAILEISNKKLKEKTQIPPMVSAIKIDGERAYHLFRKGVEFREKLKPRDVTLKSISIKQVSENLFKFIIQCSKGFYVRALIRDIGLDLGCGATLVSLCRERSEPFDISMCCSIDNLNESNIIRMDDLDKYIL